MRWWALVVLAACGGDAGQHEIVDEGELLTEEGRLREPGWSPRMLLRWDPARVHDVDQLRQWDFVTVANDEVAINLTLVDLGFLQVATVTAVDLVNGEKAESVVIAGARDGFVLSEALEGEASLAIDGGGGMSFATGAETTEIAIDLPSSSLGVAAVGDLTVRRRAEMPYLSAATPFADDPFQFFYEQKLHGMVVSGSLTLGERTWAFDESTSWASIDWGRGAWPSEATWRWAGVSGASMAMNFGEGFGDARHATENLIVVDDVPHKVGEVSWTFDRDDPSAPWRLASDDGRVDLTLEVSAPEVGGLDFGAVFSRVKKGYGVWRGEVVLDDGTVVEVDGAPGFAEEMELAW